MFTIKYILVGFVLICLTGSCTKHNSDFQQRIFLCLELIDHQMQSGSYLVIPMKGCASCVRDVLDFCLEHEQVVRLKKIKIVISGDLDQSNLQGMRSLGFISDKMGL